MCGFSTLEALAFDFQTLVTEKQWNYFMKCHKSLNQDILLPIFGTSSDSHHQHKNSGGVPPVMEFFIVFLYYVGGVGYEKISVDYPVGSQAQIRTLVQNGGFLVSAL